MKSHPFITRSFNCIWSLKSNEITRKTTWAHYVLLFSFLIISKVVSGQQCPVTTCDMVHQTLVNLATIPECGVGSVNLNGDLSMGQSDCLNGTINCHEFIMYRPSGSLTQQFTLEVGQGSGCNGELDASYAYIDGVCDTLSNGGSNTVIQFDFPINVDTIYLFFCLNSSAHVTICDLCSEPPPCDMLPMCNLEGIDTTGCAALVPAPFTDPNDVFTNIGSCTGTTLILDHEDVGDTDFCSVDSDGVDFIRTYTLYFLDTNGDTVEFRECIQNILVTPIAPVAICHDITMQLNGMGMVSITPDTVDNGSTLGCGGTLSVTPNTFTCDDLGANPVTLTVTDDCTISTCTAIVTIIEPSTPTADAGPDTTEVCISETFTATATATNGTVMWTTSGTGGFNGTETNEDAVYTPSGMDYLAGSVTLTLTVTGVCTNAVDSIVLIFIECECMVELACDEDVLRDDATVQGCNASAAPAIISPINSVFDTVSISGLNCNILYASTTTTTGTLCAGGIMVTYTYYGWHDDDLDGIRDVDEQQYSCSETFTVVDQVAPGISCPANLTIECSASTLPANTGTAVATDNCSTPTLGFSDVTAAGGCPQEYTITRTWTATDACLNTATCTQTIVVDDSTPPAITSCPANMTVECTASTLPAATGTATATDNCSTPQVTYSDVTASGSCPQEYTITRTWRATDACSNSSTCTQIITVDDSTPPTITSCPQSMTLECTANTLPPSTGIATATDNCSVPDVTFSDATVAGGCPQEYTITRTWRATDACNNSSTCIQTIIVDDSTPPTITSCPQSMTLECTANTLPPATGMATATDNCSTPSISFLDATIAGGCPQEYTIIRTWRATDACNNSSTCTQTIIVDDSTPPTITSCPASMTLECTASTLPPSTGIATATDNCSIPAVTFSDATVAGGCPQEYTIIRTWRASDGCGNSATCVQTLIIDDTTPPTIASCPGSLTVECTASTLPPATGTATATDNCSTPSVTFLDATIAGGCPQEYIIIRTWIATDACNNVSTCLQTITVDDSTPPQITSCPGNLTLECTASTLPPSTGIATATDNCSVPSVTFLDATVAGGCPQEYTIIRTWRATDACNNSSTCVQTIIIDDSTPPTITFCPVSLTIECTASTLPPSTGIATATDNCSVPSVTFLDATVAGGCPQEYIITRTWRATDACNNSSTCVQVITVDDSTPPTITFCPGSLTIECTANTLPPATGTATATDNCSTPTVTFLDATIAGGCPQEYIIVRTWRATDACNNSSICVQTIIVDDSTPPTITSCPGSITLECTASTLPPSTGIATATDNCSTPSVTFLDATVAGGCPQEYTIIRTWRATDACNNLSTCIQTIIVDDSTPPTITFCPGSVTIECTANTLPPATGTATATDNCSTPTITFLDATIAGGCPQEYIITRTWRATDACNNSSTCVQTIIVDDSTPPTITSCPGNLTLECTASTLPPSTGIATATDNCSVPSVTFLDATVAGGCPQEYIITRTWRATDACNNSSTCVQTIIIDDSTPPTITFCPVSLTIECTASTLPPSTGIATATDNCSVPSVTFLDATLAGGCPQEYIITRTWRATDACNNSSTCVQIITVDDSTPPTITFCPGSLTIECTANTLPPATGTATATDNCSTPTVTFLDATIAGGCPQEYIIVRTWRATDACNNSSTCVQTIIVDDSTPPTITSCPASLTVECTATTLPPSTGIATATDNCSTPTVTFFDATVAGGCPQEYIITRTWRATDACSNSSSCVQIITVDDSTPPVIACPSNVTIECTAVTLPALAGGPGLPGATATDNCSVPAVTFSDVTVGGGCPQEYTIFRTWRATDACNNSSTCLQTVTIDDSTAPVIVCPADVTIECTAVTLPGTGGQGVAIATDNCDISPTVDFSDVTAASTTCIQEYTITRTWTATDECGNSNTCVQVLLVDDSTPPLITCPLNVTIECTAVTLPGIGGQGTATATDNCDATPTVDFSDVTIASTVCLQEYLILRTWTAEDDCGNSNSCLQVLFVDDSTPPVITCPTSLVLECGDGSDYQTIINTWIATATATDACDGMATITDDYDNESVPDVSCNLTSGLMVTFTATDDCGNFSTCTATVYMDDTVSPLITCPDDLTLDCAPGLSYPDTILAWIAKATATDLCDQAVTITSSYDGQSIPDFECEGGMPITFTATDDCGNTATCTRTVYKPCFDLCTWVYIEGSAANPSGVLSYSIPMRTTLNDLQILPGQSLFDPFFGILYTQPGQPYDIAPWFYFGTEGDGFDSDSIPGDAGYPSTVVDWVLVSLRSDVEGTGGPVCQAAALLHNDGTVEFVEDLDCCGVDESTGYYIVIEHRNHLIVMSDTIMEFVNNKLSFDFRIQDSYVEDFGFPGLFVGQKQILPGVWAMYGGNGHQTSLFSDTDINFNDRTFWEAQNGLFGLYKIGDYNLNGDVNFNDRLLYERNNGLFTSVPRN